MTTRVKNRPPIFLWRKSVDPGQADHYEEKLRGFAGDRLAIIWRPARKRVLFEIACRSRTEGSGFVRLLGGSTKRLPADWHRRRLRAQKTKPLKIGNRSLNLVIPAGAAFGTGDHATTAVSLRLLAQLTRDWKPGWSLIDIGTGSGILALAAKRLGAQRVIGVDNDSIAISTANQNARSNKIDGVQFKFADARSLVFPGKTDIVTANLLSELLIALLPKLRRSRWLILSGILRDQEDELRRALRRNKIEFVESRRRGKWVSILATSQKSDLRKTR